MIDVLANHASRIRKYQDLYGYNNVEDFIDTCLSLDNLIDFHRIGIGCWFFCFDLVHVI